MAFFPSGDGTGPDGLFECIRADCKLRGMSQPEREGQSIVGFGRDETVTVIQQGPTSQGEENRSTVTARILSRLPKRYSIDPATGPERGADLVVSCKACDTKREIQVARAVDKDFARTSRASPVACKTIKPAEVIGRLRAIVDKKTNERTVTDRSKQILAIDAAVDELWTPILCGLESTREDLSGRGWLSIVLVGPEVVLRIDGQDVEQWCSCGGTKTTS